MSHSPLVVAGLAAGLCGFQAPDAAALQLAPYKDELFAYPAVLGTGYGGDYVVIDFDQQRDVVDRDIEPDERVKPEYVSLDVKAVEADMKLDAGGTRVEFMAVGKTTGGASVVVIFIHGLGADRFDGVNDWRSGGNLNRIKNLMARNDGVYLAPDFASGRRKAKRQIAALIDAYARNSPGAPIFLACASLGSRLCWDLIQDPETASLIDGVLMIAAFSNSAFADGPLVSGVAEPIPIYIGHGNRDGRVSWRPQQRLFETVKAANPDYPIKFVLFDTGTHRTPLRMTDWRLVLNWMLAQQDN